VDGEIVRDDRVERGATVQNDVDCARAALRSYPRRCLVEGIGNPSRRTHGLKERRGGRVATPIIDHCEGELDYEHLYERRQFPLSLLRPTAIRFALSALGQRTGLPLVFTSTSTGTSTTGDPAVSDVALQERGSSSSIMRVSRVRSGECRRPLQHGENAEAFLVVWD